MFINKIAAQNNCWLNFIISYFMKCVVTIADMPKMR